MKKGITLIILFSLCLASHAQKKGKEKVSPAILDSTTNYVMPGKKSKGKGKVSPSISDSTTNYVKPDKKSKGKKDKKESKEINVNYTPDVVIPVPDSSKKFTGVIKYRITSDDPADDDSVFIVFGENRFRVTMFIPGYREGQTFEKNMIANLNDSTFLELDIRKKTYTTEKLGARNAGTELSLAPDKKTGKVMTFICDEKKGEMKTKEGDEFEAAALVSNQHSYIYAMDYYFQNIQPLVIGYKIVLGFRTKSAENENTYIIAYKIEPGNTDSYFDLSGYQAQ
jgi:hypothetical protein